MPKQNLKSNGLGAKIKLMDQLVGRFGDLNIAVEMVFLFDWIRRGFFGERLAIVVFDRPTGKEIYVRQSVKL